MTRWEKLNKQSIAYSLTIRDFMVAHGAKEESAKTIAKIVQLSYMVGAAEADKTKRTVDDEELYQDTLEVKEVDLEKKEDKLNKAIKLADAMYDAAQRLTTDASRLHKAMQDWWKFRNNKL